MRARATSWFGNYWRLTALMMCALLVQNQTLSTKFYMALPFKDNRISAIVNLSRRAFGRHKWQIAILTALGFLSGLLEGIGVNALIPLFSFVMGENACAPDFITRNIQAFFNYFNIAFSLRYLLV